MNKPLITIVTVTYNCESEIEDTIQSVLSQDYPNLEYIIIDGASKDNTVSIANKYKDRIARIVSEPDKGLYDAMNKAITISNGKWINFLNAGDRYFDSSVISKLFEGIDVDSHYKVIYGNTELLMRDGSIVMHKTSTIASLPKIVSQYQPYTHQAVFYNIDNKKDCKYDLRYKICADYDVACRYYKRYGQKVFLYVPISICQYKGYDGVSTSPKNKKRSKKERIKIKLRNKMNIWEIFKDIIRLYVLPS